MYCKNCGSVIDDKMPFCPDCGAKQTKKPAAPDATPEQLTREARIRELSAQQAARNKTKRNDPNYLSTEFGNGLYGQQKTSNVNYSGGGKGLRFFGILALIAAAVLVIYLLVSDGDPDGVWVPEDTYDYKDAIVISDGMIYADFYAGTPIEKSDDGYMVNGALITAYGDSLKASGDEVNQNYKRLSVSSTDGVEGAWLDWDNRLYLFGNGFFYFDGKSGTYELTPSTSEYEDRTSYILKLSGDYEYYDLKLEILHDKETMVFSNAGDEKALTRIY